MSQSAADRVWDIMAQVAICMVTTHADGTMRSRPMHAFPDRKERCVWFVTDNVGAKNDEIARAPDVCLSFADTKNNTYLCVCGTAETFKDSKKAEELWSLEAQVWWPNGPKDPNVRVLRVVPQTAEYWDTRGSSVSVTLKLFAARITGRAPDLGDQKRVNLKQH